MTIRKDSQPGQHAQVDAKLREHGSETTQDQCDPVANETKTSTVSPYLE